MALGHLPIQVSSLLRGWPSAFSSIVAKAGVLFSPLNAGDAALERLLLLGKNIVASTRRFIPPTDIFVWWWSERSFVYVSAASSCIGRWSSNHNIRCRYLNGCIFGRCIFSKHSVWHCCISNWCISVHITTLDHILSILQYTNRP